MLGATALLISTIGEASPRYVWNVSNSVPTGLYRLQPAGRLTVTELVVVQPPKPLATFLDLKGYLPIGVPMLKHVLALPGQTVCREAFAITIDSIAMGEHARAMDVADRCRLGKDAMHSVKARSSS